MDLSMDPHFRVDCEVCGRRIGQWQVSEDDGPGSIAVYEVEREPLPRGYVTDVAHVDHSQGIRGKPTGRHRLRYVQAFGEETAHAVECGCGHRRTVGARALRRKLENATEPRIWL